MTRDEIKAALRAALDRLLDALVETPWTILLFAGWTLAMVLLGFIIRAL